MSKLEVAIFSCYGYFFVVALMACLAYWMLNLCTSIIDASFTIPSSSCSSVVLVSNGYSLMSGSSFSIGYYHVITSVDGISGTPWLGVVGCGWTLWGIKLCVRMMTVFFVHGGWLILGCMGMVTSSIIHLVTSREMLRLRFVMVTWAVSVSLLPLIFLMTVCSMYFFGLSSG